jgi:DNA processing protein
MAQSITSAQDLEYYMQWTADEDQSEINIALSKDDFSLEEWNVISTMQESGNDVHIDELSWKSQIQIGQLASILLNLEFRGVVNSIAGKKYTLN